MARFIFHLPDDLAGRIEAFRRAEGLKATAEAVRTLIERGLDGAPEPAEPPAPIPPQRGTTVVVSPRRTKFTAAAAPKEQIKSRLKGVWKAP